MNLNTLTAFLADAAAAPTAAPGVDPNAAGRNSFLLIGYVIALGAMFYFVAIRPQQKRTRELNNLLQALKPGDKIVTTSGIVGTVVSVKDRTVALRSAETKLEVLKSAVSEITERGGGDSGES
jgi:preprotein translocase subunit YajC